MRSFRAAALLALSVGLALGASACGNSSSGGATSGAAVYAPASTAIFATVDTDTEGDQWQALDALLAKFPDGKGAIDKALSQFGSEEGLSFENDIRPAVGDEIAIVGFDTKGEEVVLLTQPSDSAKLKKIVATGDEPGVTEELEDGWWAAAGSQESLDAFNEARKSGDSLADEDAYQDATEDLFEDAIATVYVNGRLVETAKVEPELGGAQTALAKCFGGDEDASGASFALAARAEENGIRIGGDVSSAVIPVGDDGGAELDGFFREGALAFVSTSGIGDAIREIVKCASANDSNAAQTLAQIQFALGLSVDGDLAGLFDGETGVALYAPASDTSYVSLTPTVVFATEVEDEDATMAMLENLVTKAGGLMGFMGGETSIGLEETSIEGMNAKVLLNAGNPVLYFATTDGKLVGSNSEAGLAALKSGSSLADDPAYSAGREAAGVSDDAAAVVYVNLAAAAGLMNATGMGTAFGSGEGWSEYGPGTPDVAENLEPLKSLFFWSDEPDDGSVSFEGFLQID